MSLKFPASLPENKIKPLVASGFLVLVCAADAATVIAPDAADNTIAFEAEIGLIDNSFGSSTLGWQVDAGTSPGGPSGGSWVANTENETATVPTNLLSFDINFQKTGGYTIYYRAGYTTVDFQDSRDSAGDNDSFYYEAGPLGGATNFIQQNSIAGLSNTEWVWRNGSNNNITVGASGILNWSVTGREDGFVIDRFVLVHEDETATINATFLDGLSNASVIPEPSQGVLMGLAGLALSRRRRRG